MEIIELTAQPPHGTVRVHESFECELGRNAGEPFSQFVRGMISGVMTELLGTKMFARETKCIAKKDSCCEYEIGPETG